MMIAEIDRIALAAHIKEAKEVRERTATDKEEQDLHELLRWLSPSLVEDDLRKHLNEYMDMSLDWLVASKQFKDWMDPSSGKVLQITGRPGSGKSTAASFVVQRLLEAELPVVYFFFDDSDAEKKETSHLYRTILAQLLPLDHTVAGALMKVYRKSGRTSAESSFELRELYWQALTSRQDRPIHVVLDAIDESHRLRFSGEEQDDINAGKVKFLFTGRERKDVFYVTRGGESPEPVTLELTMDRQMLAPYIKKYTWQRVQALQANFDQDLRSQVIDKVSDGADGIWLFASLMLDEVEKAPSKERVIQRLTSIPSEISGLYHDILQSRERHATQDQQEFASQLFLWLDIRDYLPEFLADDFDRLPYYILRLIFRFVNGGGEVFDAAKLAKALGAPLIEVQGLSSSYEVNFVHRSAYQYLSNTANQPLADLPVVLRPQRLKPLHRAAVAVWYFTECSDSLDMLEALQSAAETERFFGRDIIGPYIEMQYALVDALNMRGLPKDLSSEEIAQVQTFSGQLTGFLQSDQVLRWVEIATIINYSGNHAQLLDNVLTGLKASDQRLTRQQGLDQILAQMNGTENRLRPAYDDFMVLRGCIKSFCSEWAYIIQETTSWQMYDETELAFPKPDSLDMNGTVTKRLAIGQKWRKLLPPDDEYIGEPQVWTTSGSGEQRFEKPQSSLFQCPACSQVLGGRANWKRHRMRMCNR
ncbi:MAG: hypothetical protein M1822_010128 [Bathelium mastoideum]|nr:MAG: hypothetical protein M1822_010128 [Bathelium mastoideum]